jgi:copper chaperone
MIELSLPAMSCGHCVSAVTQACKEVDPQAKVEVDLGSKQVRIDSAKDRQSFAAALDVAGYPPA